MSTVAKPLPITIEQYLGFQCPAGFRDELINGEIVVSPDPKPLHHDIAANIFLMLERQIAARHGREFKVGQRTNMQMPRRHSMPSPDVWVLPMKAWREARLNDTYPVGAPLLAVEVLSRANSKLRIQQKVELYLSEGSVEVWIVHPKKQTISVYRRDGEVMVYDGVAQHSLSSAVAGIEIAVADIFRLD